MATHTHLLDAYGDPEPSEVYDFGDGPVDTYGDPVPVELFAVTCDDPDCPDSQEA